MNMRNQKHSNAQVLLQRHPSIFSKFPQRHHGQLKCGVSQSRFQLSLMRHQTVQFQLLRDCLHEDGETTFPWVYMQKFSSVWRSNREGIKHGGRKPQKYNLGLSAPFTGVDHNNQLVVTPNEMVGHYCRDYPLNDPQLFFSGLSLVLGSYKQRQFTWHQADLSISQL